MNRFKKQLLIHQGSSLREIWEYICVYICIYMYIYLMYIFKMTLLLSGYGAPAGGQATKGNGISSHTVLNCKAKVQDSQNIN